MKQKLGGTSSSNASTRPRRAPQTLVDIMYLRIDRLCKRTGLPRPRLSRAQQDTLRVLFVTAYAEAVAYDEKVKFLQSIDNG